MLATPPAPRLAPAAGTERALREVVRRARPFHERLHAARAAPVPPGDPSPAALKRLATWRETLSRGDDAAFNLRLAWDGLDEAAALAAMGDAPAEDGDAPLPAWAQVLRGAYAWDQGGVTLELAPDDRALDASDPLPFEPALLPLVRHARGQVERACGPASTLLHANAHAALERSLLKRLASLCAKALFARFSAARAMRGMGGMFAPAADGTAYDAFVASLGGGGMLRFFSDVPVAARLAGTATLQWIDTTAELLQRLGDDTPRLRDELFGGAAPGGVRRLRCDAADFHGGGRSVYILEFESGARAVYKPRPLALEPAFAGLAAWLAAQPEGVELRVPAVVALPTHGWLEFVERAPCRDEAGVRRYHQRCGALLALVYALGGTDFHHENLLACGEHPVLIDLETLLAHRFDLVERVPNQAFGARVVRERMQLSVLATQMLPHLKLAADGQGASSGALRRAVPAREGEVPAWLDCNADTMRPGRRRVQLPPEDASLPTADGRPVPAAEHVDALVEGFTTTYRLLMGGREALLAPGGAVDRMRGQPVRFILRHTSLYTALLERCLHPSFLGDGVARGIELDVLCRPFVALGEKPAAWPALRAEMRELEQLDVPIFTPASDSTSLPVGDGEEAPGCFERDAFGETVRRLKSLDEADLALQVRLVHAAFLADESPGLCSIVSPSSSQAAAAGDDAEIESVALREAREIARTLAASAVWGDDGEAGWFSASYAPRARRFDAGAGAANLLDGYVGTAFFLAALHRVSPEDGVRDLAVAALRPLSAHLDTYAGMFRQRRDRDLGAGTGFGSLLYALPHLAAWLGQPALLGAARELSTLLDGLPAPEPMRCDLVSGAAGVIPGLLLLHRLGDADALERARAAGRGLLEARVREPRDGLALWAGNRGLAEAGLAHGQSGIASALFRLATASGDDEFAAAAREALVFERRMVAESGGNTPEAHAAWSTGDTGIGLALAAAGPHAGAEEIAALERAVERSLAHRLHGGDAACGGFPGRVELMLSAGQALGRPEWAAEARRTAVDAAARATARGGWRTGWEPFAHPGLFVGLSGIGYQLLRAAPPHVLPPVLSWG